MQNKYQSILKDFFHTEKITEYSLEKITLACEYFGNPQNEFKSIHIAGTNGKGSVAKMIFQMLKESGKKIGVYTSPHNIDIRERFETEDGQISERDFIRLAEQIIAYDGGLSYYERCTLLAFLYFRESGCEYAVIEVGMGGRLDATNIITPILSIITSISYDHMEFLGDTLEKISYEKGGIIKSNIPVILYGKNNTLEGISKEKNAEVLFPIMKEVSTNLLGEYQLQNARIAYTAGKNLHIPEDTISHALLHVDHHGRLEYVRDNLLVDGAHNQDGLIALEMYLSKEKQKWEEIIYCINLKEGKAASLILDIFPEVYEWNIVQSSGFIVRDAQSMVSEIISLGKKAQIITPTEIQNDAIENPQKLFVVFGSLYMIGEFLGQ